MSTSLGRIEDLPPQYVSGLRERNVVPLWPSLRDAIPYDKPGRKTQPTLWRYGQLRPELMRAGTLAPIEKAERRVLVRYPWAEVKSTLEALAGVMPRGECAHLAYVNPQTGDACLPTLGFSALRLAPREPVTLPRRSASAVLHVVEGEGSAVIDGTRIEFSESDTVAIPTHATVRLEATGAAPTCLFMVDDGPLQRKIGIYQVFERGSER